MGVATTSYPEIPTSSRGSVGPRVSSTTKAPPIPSITPVKTNVGLPKIGASATKPLVTKPVKTNVQVAPNQDDIRAVVGRMPGPTGHAYDQAHQVVASELDPIVAQLIGGYTQQGHAGAAAINAVTQEYAQQLAGLAPEVTADYAGAEQGTAATNAALQQLVAGGGAADANALATRLASIGSPNVVNPVVGQLAGNAAGAGTALYGSGSATLDALLAAGAAQRAEALKLPFTAREAGIQGISQYLGGLASAESKDLNTIAGKAPGLEQSAANAILSQGEKRAALAAEGKRTAATVAGENARSKATIAAENQRTASEQKTQRTKAAIATILATNIDPNTGTLTPAGVLQLKKLGIVATPGSPAGSVGAGIDKANAVAAAKATQDSIKNNQTWQRIQIEQQNANTSAGRLRLARTKQAAAAGGSGVKPMTAHEIGTLVKGWHDGSLRSVTIPAIDPTTHKQATSINGAPIYDHVTKTVGQVGYVQAIQGLVGLGVPVPVAAKAVNGIYGDQMAAVVHEFAQTAAQRGMTEQAALAFGQAQGIFPPQALTAAIRQAYAPLGIQATSPEGAHVGPGA